MTSFDLIVRNAKVATASDIFSTDIGVAGGKITQLGGRLGGASREIDAGGRWVLPGGIDTHCHFDQPSINPAIVMADDLYSGSLSAAHGGTTTIVPFAAQMPGQSMRAAVDDYHRRAAGKPVIDYAFHLIIADPTAQVLGQELPALIREGYTSFKVYMTYEGLKLNDRQILEVLALARREGAMTMVHAENSDCVDYLTELLLAAGKTQPIYHAHSRPRLVEREGSHRAITLSELIDVPILLVHVSGEETVEQIRWAQARGLKVYGETCPQYLLLSEEDLDHPHFEGAKYVCSPPPRDKKNQEAIWRALANGTFHVFSSDHSAYRFAGGDGKDHHGKGADFTKIPNGLPGVETRLPLLFSEGVMKGRIDINQFVALTATNPAKIYGLYPRKGTIAVGSDADLVIWDHERRFNLTNADLHHNCDYTPYEGQEITGWPSHVISRGEVIVEAGQTHAAKGRGQFLACDLPAPARSRQPL